MSLNTFPSPRTILLLSLSVLCLLNLSSAWADKTPAAAWKTFKSYYDELYRSPDLTSYILVETKYAGAEKMAKIKQSQGDLKKIPAQMFFPFFKSDLHPVEQLTLERTDVQGNQAVVHYLRKGHPEFSGEARLSYEKNVWKMVGSIQKTVQKDKGGKMTMKTSF